MARSVARRPVSNGKFRNPVRSGPLGPPFPPAAAEYLTRSAAFRRRGPLRATIAPFVPRSVLGTPRTCNRFWIAFLPYMMYSTPPGARVPRPPAHHPLRTRHQHRLSPRNAPHSPPTVRHFPIYSTSTICSYSTLYLYLHRILPPHTHRLYPQPALPLPPHPPPSPPPTSPRHVRRDRGLPHNRHGRPRPFCRRASGA